MHPFIVDSQMVSHILWTTKMGSLASRTQNNLAQTASSSTPRSTPWNLFLHYDRMAQLATRKIVFLADSRNHNRKIYWVQTTSWWFEMGPKTILNEFLLFVHSFLLSLSIIRPLWTIYFTEYIHCIYTATVF